MLETGIMSNLAQIFCCLKGGKVTIENLLSDLQVIYE